MSRPSKKEIKVTADQIARGINYFEELNVPFIAVFQDIDTVFTNVPRQHAISLLQYAAQYQTQLIDKEIEAKVERAIETGQWGITGTGTNA